MQKRRLWRTSCLRHPHLHPNLMWKGQLRGCTSALPSSWHSQRCSASSRRGCNKPLTKSPGALQLPRVVRKRQGHRLFLCGATQDVRSASSSTTSHDDDNNAHYIDFPSPPPRRRRHQAHQSAPHVPFKCKQLFGGTLDEDVDQFIDMFVTQATLAVLIKPEYALAITRRSLPTSLASR